MSSICDVPGIRVGHSQNTSAKTGCTVILPEKESVAGIDIRGSAPGTRETEVLQPVRLINHIHGILLTGGSAFGLNAAAGVQRYLESIEMGYDVGVAKIPIVPAAVIFDLAVGDASVRPDEKMGYDACINASHREFREGLIGAGCGATVGKIRGQAYASAGGIGTCSHSFSNGVVIGVLTVVNPLGEVIDPETNAILAGAKTNDGTDYVESLKLMEQMSDPNFPSANTTLSVVATNAEFNKEDCIKIAQMAQDGFARTIRPAHTLYDGDIVFAMSCGEKQLDINLAGAMACELVAESIVRAVHASQD